MTDRRPLVSILVPAFRHEAYVADCIHSIWAQACRDLEIVACDDASPDATPSILRALAAESPVPMRVLENPANRGVCATLNRCLAEARGRWIGMIASDDMYMPRFLAENLAAARSGSGDMVVQQSGAWRLREDGYSLLTLPPPQPSDPAEIRRRLALGQGYIMAPSIFTSRAVLDAVGGFDESLCFEDLDFLLRATRVARFGYLREPLVVKRSVPGSLGHASSRLFRDRLATVRRNLSDSPATAHEAVRLSHRRFAHAAGYAFDRVLWREILKSARASGAGILPPVVGGLHGASIQLGRRILGPGRYGRWKEEWRRLCSPHQRTMAKQCSAAGLSPLWLWRKN